MILRKFKRENDILSMISWLWMMPLLSLPELATVTGLTYNRCNRLMKDLYHQGRATSVRLGMTLELQNRWILTTSGVTFAMERLGYSLEWQVSEAGLKLLIRRLPTLETFYRLAPSIWGHDGVERIRPIYRTPDPDEDPLEFPVDLRLRRFQWQREADIHAICEYANEAWIPWIWVGPMTKQATLAEKLRRGVTKLAGRSPTWEVSCPAGWVVVGADVLAADQASRMWLEDDMLAITADGRTLKSMRPRDFTPACFEDSRASRLGTPERIPSWVEEEPAVRALNGKLTFKLFRFTAQWPGARVGQLQTWSTDSHGEINKALKEMGKENLIANLDSAFYINRPGMLAAAQMDRISHQNIYGSFDVYARPNGNYRKARRRHDQAVVDVILEWHRLGCEVFHGRRWVLDLPDKTQVAPDALLAKIDLDSDVSWWFVEVELSARAPSSVRRKLHPYRRFQQQYGQSLQLMVFVDTQGAEDVFRSEGRGLTMSVFTLDQFLATCGKVTPGGEP